MLVREIMNREPVILNVNSSVEELFRIFAKSSVGSVIVIDKESKPVQIFTLRDVPKIFFSSCTSVSLGEALKVLNKVPQNLITIKENKSFIDALHVMEKFNISHLPVINKHQKLVGIVSLRDLIKNVPELIFVDPLTGVNNRSYLNLITLKLQHLKTVIGILMIDLDRFKSLNDTYGHLVGDEVLKRVAQTIRKNVKGGDEVIRFGGEEFLVLAYRCEIKTAKELAERLRLAVEHLKFPRYPRIKVTVSIGVSEYNGTKDFWEAVREADDAMYLAKTKGRNRVEVYSQVLPSHSKEAF